MTFGEKLKIARTESGLKQSELAKKLNTTGNTISNWENNVSKPDLDTLSYICGILHVTASYFLQATIPEDEVSIPELKLIKKYRSLDNYGQETVSYILDREVHRVQQIRETQEYNTELTGYTYPYLGKIACAGTGFYFDDIPTDTIEAPYVEGADFIIGVSGESMEPDYHDGEKLYVRKVEYLRNGDVGIFTIGNECFLKELGENGLISRNKNYDDVPGDEKIRLVGKVIGKVEI